ncbi:MAG: T9SS type A sorting domain-containing protein [bacterium]|nr:T9SS type A sorting domain-containing protein [bacterium]
MSLDVPLHQDVTVSLYDLLGREVDVIYRGRLSSQTISYVAPAGMASGVYFLRAAVGERSVLGKVVLLK